MASTIATPFTIRDTAAQRRVALLSLALCATLAGACSCPDGVSAVEDGADVDADGPVGFGGSEGEGEGAGGEGEGEGEGEGAAVTRFVALGDSGRGDAGQYLVADAIADVCAERGGCAFAILLGDNIYNQGAASAQDAQWQEKFELPYAALSFPFYATLGNHDYGAPDVMPSSIGGIGIDPTRGAAQVSYSESGNKFYMPGTHYRAVDGPVELVSLNTASMFWADLPIVENITGYGDENDRQRTDLAAWNANPLATWRIAFGHHPYRSNGPHGNAGGYDGVFVDGLVGSGSGIRDFLEDAVIGTFDLYLCGHDHSLQDLGEAQGTRLLVSGGGASHTDLDGTNVAEFEMARRGFTIFEATETYLAYQFVVVPDDDDDTDAPYSFGPLVTLVR